MLHGDEAGGVAAGGIEMVPVKGGNGAEGAGPEATVRAGSGQRDRSGRRLRLAFRQTTADGRTNTRGELGGGQMTLECGIVQRAVRRAIKGRLSVQPDGNARNALLVADAQVQHLEHTIKLHQIAGGQMNRQVGRLIERVHAE